MAGQLHLFKGRRQRGIEAAGPSEFQLHCAVADVLKRWCKPTWIYSHLPMGEYRTPATAARLKRMGVTAGFPDFLLLSPNKGGPFFLELKRRGGRLSEAQAGFELWCLLNGYPFGVAHDVREAIEVLAGWGAVRSGIEVQ